MKFGCCEKNVDYGGRSYVTNVEQVSVKNTNFRTTVWTGSHLQMTVMCIPPCGEIGLEIHPETDQFIRVEQGKALAQIGECKCCLDFEQTMCQGDAVFIPAGMWHNVINLEKTPLKVSVIYAPPNHPKGTVHRTKEEADRAEY